jgi:hypothetical protein
MVDIPLGSSNKLRKKKARNFLRAFYIFKVKIISINFLVFA